MPFIKKITEEQFNGPVDTNELDKTREVLRKFRKLSAEEAEAAEDYDSSFGVQPETNRYSSAGKGPTFYIAEGVHRKADSDEYLRDHGFGRKK